MNEQSIFIAALEQPPVERAGFLDRVCEQIPELRQRVEKLLQFHEAADGFMEPSDAVFAQTLIQPPLEREGTRIGTYVLREQLGEGGMGIVYVAEQREPVRRLVALKVVKVVKPGMDTREVLARFEAERQALAVMNHPHIAKILDGGATETGRPYFVMELVKGIAITEYCDQHKLSVRQRLELFILVCEAVQHAHQKGVIHRDLKPSNVLVELHDVTPVPKVIDFGIAKATNQQLSQHTIYTQFAQLVGTPLYMSPEQAQLSGLDVDTRSDIYSLGVMLYELLTGSTPFDSTTLTKAGLEEMRRIIREDEPLRPSQKVSTLHAELLSTVSTRRQADARKLSVSMRRELDWIVMRAMEKDRQRRYDSASALAGDIRRYLNDEPVQACPPSTAYRLQKFARRHRAMLTTATVVSTAILVGAVLSLWQAVEATNARKLADKRLASEQQARGEAEDERNRADTERERAEASFAKALEAVDRMLTRVGAESLQDIPQMEVIQKQILQDAVEFYEGFLVQRGSDPKVRSEAASIYVRIGQIYFKFDQTAECNQAFHRANSLYIALHAEQPDDVPIRQALALSHAHLGWAAVNLQEREHHHRRTIELLTPIAERPDVVGSLANSYRSLADVLNSLNRLDESEQQFKKAIALCQEHPGWDENVLPSTYSGLALLLERTGRIAESIDAMEQALRLKERIVVANPTTAFYRIELARDSRRLGDLLVRANRYEAAVERFQKSIEIGERLVREFPSVPVYRIELVASQEKLMLAYLKLSQTDAARQLIQQLDPRTVKDYLARGRLYEALEDVKAALADYEQALQQDPTNRSAQDAIFNLLIGWGFGGGSPAENKSRCLELAVQWTELSPDSAACWHRLGTIRNELGQHDLAIEAIEKAVALDPHDSQANVGLIDIHISRGDLSRALTLAEVEVVARPMDFYRWYKLGNVHDRMGRYDPAVQGYTQALERAPDASWIYKGRGLARFKLGRFDEALADIAKAVELRAQDTSNLTWIPAALVAACPDEKFRSGILALADKTIEQTGRPDAIYARAALYAELKQWDRARADLERVLATDTTPNAWYQFALSCLASGDNAAYREACGKMLSKFRDRQDMNELRWTVWVCVLESETVDDYPELVELARRGHDTPDSDAGMKQTLGAALYRAGRFEQALGPLVECETAPGASKITPLYSRFFLAMAHQKLGNATEARQSYEQAASATERMLRDGKTEGGDPLPWNRRLTLQRLGDEARKLIRP